VVLFGGFRTSPWLDDTWFFWLPKGLALDHHGLDPRLFIPNQRYVSINSEAYPLWWPSLMNLNMRFAGGVDLRAVNAQLALLLAGFVTSVARLLAGFVRPYLLWPGLLLLVVSPELIRQAQGGGADLPTAFFSVLAALAAMRWLANGERFALVLVFVFASAAIQAKEEGQGLVIIFLVALGVFAIRRAVWLWAVLVLAFATEIPWHLWRREHAVGNPTGAHSGVAHILHLEATATAGKAARSLLHHLVNPREWLLAIPLALALALAATVRGRSARHLAVPLLLGLGYVFWIAVYWGNSSSSDIQGWLNTSAYRVVDSLVLAAAVFTPVLAERVLSPRPLGSAATSGKRQSLRE
jgi:hypothetical protein